MRTRTIAALIALSFCSYVLAQTALLSGATATGAGAWFPVSSGPKMFQGAAVSTAGTGTAVISAQCTIDGVNTITLGTTTFATGTTTISTDGFTSDDRCRLIRANVTTISGTGTTASMFVNQ